MIVFYMYYLILIFVLVEEDDYQSGSGVDYNLPVRNIPFSPSIKISATTSCFNYKDERNVKDNGMPCLHVDDINVKDKAFFTRRRDKALFTRRRYFVQNYLFFTIHYFYLSQYKKISILLHQ